MNTAKTVLLMGVLTVLLVFVGNLIGGQGGMMIAFLMAIVMNFGTYWFSDRIVLGMYHGRELAEQDNPSLFQMVRELAGRAGLPMPRVYLVEGDQPNAFATGRDPEHAAIAVTEGILRTLPPDQLRGVLSHEFAHVKHRDILIGTVAATMAGAISMIASMAQWALIFGGAGGNSNDRKGGSPLGGLLMIVVAPIAAMLVQMAISRSREFEADAGGAEISGNPLALANALRTLDTASHEIPMEASPATAHMFIVNPLTGGGLANLFSTHPPMEERIARLEGMTYGPGAAGR
ncbi:MAG TPA: zinc metalloprotease HtpX [Bacteroidota bacterium]|nr:zinc metalloprotease HtpX [Bacteroidota bacterium]